MARWVSEDRGATIAGACSLQVTVAQRRWRQRQIRLAHTSTAALFGYRRVALQMLSVHASPPRGHRSLVALDRPVGQASAD